MGERAFTRRLSAILSADAAGYSRLMRADEEATVRAITSLRAVMAAKIIQYRGRVVDSPGDNMLAEFPSVVDAVKCAVGMQAELARQNAQAPAERRMLFRMGLNMGDVIEDGGRIYGDGVNVAARMEGLAEPGGVCVSGAVFDAVEGKTTLGYRFLGEHEVKNIDKPIRAYQVLPHAAAGQGGLEARRPAGKPSRGVIVAVAAAALLAAALAGWHLYPRPTPIRPATPKAAAHPLPDKPSIAVLPFANMSGDPGQDYFADGMTEEIITALSKTPKLFVIARNSSFTYKGKPVWIPDVARQLGVRYVLEGSVRKSGDKVRITAQLIDAANNRHLWAERYDLSLGDIFAVQDDITKNIVTAMEVKLTKGEAALLYARGTKNLQAYLLTLRAGEYQRKTNKEDNLRARRLCHQAIALDPTYPMPYMILGYTYWNDVFLGWSEDPKRSTRMAAEMARKCIALDDSSWAAHSLLAWIYLMQRKHDLAIAEGERAVALNPNSAEAHGNLGNVFNFSGKPEKGRVELEKAIRLNPFPPSRYFTCLAMSYRELGRYGEAIATCQKSLRLQPRNVYTLLNLTASYSLSGQMEKARQTAARVLKVNPGFSLAYLKKARPHNDAENTARFVAALKAGGLK